MRSTILITFFALLVVGAQCDGWADNFPFCKKPYNFPVSMTTSPAKVDLNKFKGTWYEIASFPSAFQGDCVCSQANYAINPEGYVDVKNTCTQSDGKSVSVNLKGYSRNPENTRLEVYIVPIVSANYWILDIDAAYQWAIIGEPCKKSAWILSRVGKASKEFIDRSVNVLKSKGYDVSGLKFRPASC